MQTFLPYPSYFKSARVLHPKHLGNQFYREGLTLLRGGWKHHPASKMWQGHMWSLTCYLLELYEELKRRGYFYPHIAEEIIGRRLYLENTGKPLWLGDPGFHASHRSNLLRKDKEKGWNWYSKLGWNEPDDLPYVWPV